MDAPKLQAASDLSAAQWIAAQLGGAVGAVTRAVPGGYPAYARICHPVADETGAFVTWTQVAQVTGRRPHPLMQWHALIGSPDAVNPRGTDWPGYNPTRGNLEPEVLAPLCDVLGQHTNTAQECYFCLWEGFGWYGATRQTFMGTKQITPPWLPQDVLDADRVQHPSRTYILLTGVLATAMQLAETLGQSPNIFWPADRAWCVASEIDFDSTLVAGSQELITALLDDPALDAWQIKPTDSSPLPPTGSTTDGSSGRAGAHGAAPGTPVDACLSSKPLRQHQRRQTRTASDQVGSSQKTVRNTARRIR